MKGQHKRKRESERTTLTIADKLKIAGVLTAGFLFLFGWIHLAGTRNQAAAFDRQIENWRRDYHLTDEQARRLRDIETEFHGSGNPLFRTAHTAEQMHEHHQAVANVMNSEDRARFLKGHGTPDRSH